MHRPLALCFIEPFDVYSNAWHPIVAICNCAPATALPPTGFTQYFDEVATRFPLGLISNSVLQNKANKNYIMGKRIK